MSDVRIRIMKKILSANDEIASQLRRDLRDQGVLLVNIMSSPGSGKTSLIEKTVARSKRRIAVIEGDIQTTLDAERLARLGIKTYQINTGPFGGDCHLEAAWVRGGVDELGTDGLDLLFVENIGNLVCPAEFDIGAHLNVIMLSVAEGEDKPLKYPLAFTVAGLCLISKVDLLPHLTLSIEKMKENIGRVNPGLEMIEVSAQTGQGIDLWLDCLERKFAELKS